MNAEWAILLPIFPGVRNKNASGQLLPYKHLGYEV